MVKLLEVAEQPLHGVALSIAGVVGPWVAAFASEWNESVGAASSASDHERGSIIAAVVNEVGSD